MLLGQAIIDSLGWRLAYLTYAAIIVVVCVPAILLCVRDYPADCGLQPYGKAHGMLGLEEAPADAPAPKKPVSTRLKPKHALVRA